MVARVHPVETGVAHLLAAVGDNPHRATTRGVVAALLDHGIPAMTHHHRSKTVINYSFTIPPIGGLQV